MSAIEANRCTPACLLAAASALTVAAALVSIPGGGEPPTNLVAPAFVSATPYDNGTAKHWADCGTLVEVNLGAWSNAPTSFEVRWVITRNGVTMGTYTNYSVAPGGTTSYDFSTVTFNTESDESPQPRLGDLLTVQVFALNAEYPEPSGARASSPAGAPVYVGIKPYRIQPGFNIVATNGSTYGQELHLEGASTVSPPATEVSLSWEAASQEDFSDAYEFASGDTISSPGYGWWVRCKAVETNVLGAGVEVYSAPLQAGNGAPTVTAETPKLRSTDTVYESGTNTHWVLTDSGLEGNFAGCFDGEIVGYRTRFSRATPGSSDYEVFATTEGYVNLADYEWSSYLGGTLRATVVAYNHFGESAPRDFYSDDGAASTFTIGSRPTGTVNAAQTGTQLQLQPNVIGHPQPSLSSVTWEVGDQLMSSPTFYSSSAEPTSPGYPQYVRASYTYENVLGTLNGETPVIQCGYGPTISGGSGFYISGPVDAGAPIVEYQAAISGSLEADPTAEIAYEWQLNGLVVSTASTVQVDTSNSSGLNLALTVTCTNVFNTVTFTANVTV